MEIEYSTQTFIKNNFYIKQFIRYLKESKRYNSFSKKHIEKVIKKIHSNGFTIYPHVIGGQFYNDESYNDLIFDKFYEDIKKLIHLKNPDRVINDNIFKKEIKQVVTERELYSYLRMNEHMDDNFLMKGKKIFYGN